MDGVWCTLSEPLAPRVALGDAQGCILYILQTVLPATSVPGTNQENYGAYLLQYLPLVAMEPSVRRRGYHARRRRVSQYSSHRSPEGTTCGAGERRVRLSGLRKASCEPTTSVQPFQQHAACAASVLDCSMDDSKIGLHQPPRTQTCCLTGLQTSITSTDD